MRVPVYDSPQVGAAALPAVRQTLDVRNGLGAVGQGVAQLGRGVQHVVDAQDEATRRAQHEADVAASTKAITDWQNRAVDVEHGTADGKTPGFYSLQGDAAVAQSAPTLEQLAKAKKEIATKLANDTQRQLFLGHTSGLMVGHRKAVEDYTSRQIQVVQAQRAKALTDSAVRVAGANYADDGMAADAEETARAALFAHMVGQPEEAKQEALDGLRQRMASARLESAIQGEDLGTAERLLADRGAQLGPARAKYERTVATLKAKKLGEKNAAATIAVATNPETGLVDEATLDAAMDAQPETVKTPEFLAAFQQQKAQALALDKGHRAGVFRDALSQYLRGGEHLAAVKADTLSWLEQNDPEGALRLRRLAEQDAAAKKREASGGGSGPTEAQVAAYNRLRVDMKDNPEKYAAMSSEEFDREWAPQLSRSDWASGGAKLADIHGQANKPDKDLRLPALATQSLTQVFRDAYGLTDPKMASTSKWTPAQQKLFYDALNQVELHERQWKKEHGGNAPPLEQYTEWGQDELAKHPVPGTGITIPLLGTIGATKTNRVEQRAAGKLPPDAPKGPAPVSAAGLNLDASPVPGDARARILASFGRHGRTPTEKDIQNAYVAGVAQGIFQ